ncbi:MAG: glycosyltransferase [Nitrospina sp.]|nr:glycosyltransferase [Nitrospina sp.]MBT6345693.1 glycosyltransferase [Nitrospina sp.]
MPESNKPLKHLRMLVLATTYPRWENDSTPHFVFDLNRQLAQKVETWVLVPHSGGAKYFEEKDGVRIIRFPYFFPTKLQCLCYDGGILPNLKSSWLARLQLPFFLIFQFLAILKAVRKYKINFIHCNWIIPQGFFTLIISKLFNIPYLLTALGADVFAFRGLPGFRKLKSWVLKHSSLCTANSHDLIEQLKLLSPTTPLQYIPVGVDEKFFTENNYDPQLKVDLNITGPFLLGVGRFAEKKGFKYLIDAMPAILKSFPETKLVLIGYGPKESELKSQVKSLGLGQNILFVGGKSRSDLSRYYATADIFIGPSIVAAGGDTEGQPAAFIETMASKTAIIASDVGGIKDVVMQGKTGLMIQQKNSQQISDAVLSLCNDKEFKQLLEKNGRQHIMERFCWQAIAKKYLGIYERMDQDLESTNRPGSSAD